MRKLVAKIRFETLVVTALAFVTVTVFTVLVNAVLNSQPIA